MVSRIWVRAKKSGAARRSPGRPTGLRAKRMRPADRALSAALDQLRAGVPLIWTQIEDDSEIATLSALQDAAWECKTGSSSRPNLQLKQELFDRLSARLPAPKPVPVKEPPRALAGFSERVPVLTQAEEDVPRLSMTTRSWVGIGAIGLVALLLILWGLGAFNALFKPSLSFTWIDVRQSGKTLAAAHYPQGWQEPRCQALDPANPASKRTFLALPDDEQLRQSVGFPVDLLPARITVPSTYTFALLERSVSPCVENVPDPSDPGAIIRISYASTHQIRRTSGDVSSLVFFQAKQYPMSIDVAGGGWEEVRSGDAHGIYWHGAPYHDLEGAGYIGDVSVLVVEKGDIVSTIIGQSRGGITKELLLALVGLTGRVGQSPTGFTVPRFAWTDLTKSGSVISPRQAPRDTPPLKCPNDSAPPGTSSGRFTELNNAEAARAYAGFEVKYLPKEGAQPVTYSVRDIRAQVRPCTQNSLQQSDPGATVKLTYPLRTVSGQTNLESLVVVFESVAKPGTFDLSTGRWEEITVGDAHMLYWSGSNYRDPEGNLWPTDVDVLLVEKGNYTLLLLGFADAGVSKDLLVELASAVK